MTDRLQALLADAAEGARDYADPDRAVRAARWRRTVTVLAGAVAVAFIAGGLAFLTGPVRTPDPVPPADSSRYPATVAVPSGARPLPDAPVGPAALIWAPCPLNCDPYLVLSDGTQYALPRAVRGEATATYTLSPDGHRLGRPAGDAFRITDLTTGSSVDLADSGPGVSDVWAWSPDSRWLMLVRHVDGKVDHLQVVDVATGERRQVAGGAGTPVAIRSDGTVVSWAAGALVTGSAMTSVRPALASQVRAGESVHPENLLLGTADDQGVVIVDKPTPGDSSGTGQPAAVLVMSLADGRPVRRIDLPADGIWSPRTATPAGVLAVHSSAAGTQVVRVDTTTGDEAVLSTLPADSQVVLRGTLR